MNETENGFAAERNETLDGLATAARKFVKKAADAAMERTTNLHTDIKKATASFEQSLIDSVGEVADLTRQAQHAAYEDAEAFLHGVDKLASANCVGEAVQIYVDYVRASGDVAVRRARVAGDYVAKMWADGAKTMQDNIAKVGVFGKAA